MHAPNAMCLVLSMLADSQDKEGNMNLVFFNDLGQVFGVGSCGDGNKEAREGVFS